MKKQKKIPPLTREYTSLEIGELILDMNSWFFEKEGNIFLDDLLLVEKKIPQSDITNLLSQNSDFETAYNNALKIELTKLKKFGAADRLNSSMVKQILINKHNWI